MTGRTTRLPRLRNFDSLLIGIEDQYAELDALPWGDTFLEGIRDVESGMRRQQGTTRHDFGLVTLEQQHIIRLLVLDIIPPLVGTIANRIRLARAMGVDQVGGLEVSLRVDASVIGNSQRVILNWSTDGSPDVENLGTSLAEPLGIVTKVQEDSLSAGLGSLINVRSRHRPACLGVFAELILLSRRRRVADGVVEDEGAAHPESLLEERVDLGIILVNDLLLIEEVVALQFTIILDPLEATVVRNEPGQLALGKGAQISNVDLVFLRHYVGRAIRGLRVRLLLKSGREEIQLSTDGLGSSNRHVVDCVGCG